MITFDTGSFTLVDKEKTVKESQPDEYIRPAREMLNLKLTPVELAHLRDLMSIKLPPTLQKTISQALAEKEARPLSEANLWARVASICANNGLPIGDEAPDFIVGFSGIPEIRVFEISGTPVDQDEEEDDEDEEDEGKPNSPFGENA